MSNIAYQGWWYEEGIIQLAILLPHPVEEIGRLFKEWAAKTVFSGPQAMKYCLDRAQRGLSMPWGSATPSGSETDS
jgi:hypothetical protein